MKLVKNILFVSYLKNKGIRRLCFVVGLVFSIAPACFWINNIDRNFYNLSFENLSEVQKNYKYNPEVLENVFHKYPADFGNKIREYKNWERFFIDDYSEDFKRFVEIKRRCLISGKKMRFKVTDPSGYRMEIENDETPTKDVLQGLFDLIKHKNFGEFRKKYPMYDDFSNDELAFRLHKKYFSYMSLGDFREKIGLPKRTLDEIFNENSKDSMKPFVSKQSEDKFTDFCQKLESYLSQEIKVSRYNFLYFLQLWYVVLVFYIPFLLCCIVKWIYKGFKESRKY